MRLHIVPHVSTAHRTSRLPAIYISTIDIHKHRVNSNIQLAALTESPVATLITQAQSNEADNQTLSLEDEPGAAQEAGVVRAGAGRGRRDQVRRRVPGRERRPRQEARGAAGRGDDAVGGCSGRR
jgi:hypothetical protein